MIAYLILAVVAFICVIMDDGFKIRKKIRASRIISAALIAILILLSATRAPSVGADTSVYMRYFQKIQSRAIGESLAGMSFLEPGYILFNKLASFFSENPQIITAFVSILSLLVLFIFIKKNSKDPVFSIYLFITLGFFQTSLNISRSCCAVFIAYVALSLMSKRKMLAILLFVVAFSFHKTVAILLLIPLLEKLNLRRKHIKYYLLAGVVLFLALDFLMPYIGMIVPESYSSYFKYGTEGVIEKVALLILHLAIFIMPLLYIEKDKRISKENKRYYAFILLEILFYLFSIKYVMFTRVAYIFSMYTMISVPNLLQEIDRKKQRNIKKLLATLCLAQFSVRLLVNNIGATIPYRNIIMEDNI